MSVSQVSVPLSAEGAGVLVLLMPHLAGMVVERVQASPGLVQVWVRSAAGGAACPGCGAWCTRVHDRYARRLKDAPAGGQRVLIWLVTRLLRCGGPGCGGFAEQPAGLASRYARVTPLLGGQLAAVAAALCGRAGSRLARAVLAVQVSRHTLIRIVMGLPAADGQAPVRVLGVDDFSLRKGREYATLLVDMETGEPVDVLPDRRAVTVAAWLEQHPEVEVICRDRAGAYAEAAREGAPQAVQVADRWHLWHNLCEYASKAVARHAGCLAGPGCASHDARHDSDPGPGSGIHDDDDDQDQEEEGGLPAGTADVIRARHAAVHQLRDGGQTREQAAAALGITSQLAGRFWRAGTADALLKTAGASSLDPYKPYLRRRWDEGTTSAAALHREITALGCQGSELTTYRWLAVLKLAAPARPRPPAPPGKQQVTQWMLTDPGRLEDGERDQRAAILARCPELTAMDPPIRRFAKILTGRPARDRRRGPGPCKTRHRGARLDRWLDDAGTCPALQPLVSGIRRDYQAVVSAVTLPWSSGGVEGLNTRSKHLERQMYGRAGFPLVRKRILLTS